MADSHFQCLLDEIPSLKKQRLDFDGFPLAEASFWHHFALSTCFTKLRANATTQHKAARVKDAPVLGSKCIEKFAG